MDKRAKQNAPQPLDGGHVEVRGGLDITHMTILLSKQALEIGVRLFHVVERAIKALHFRNHAFTEMVRPYGKSNPEHSNRLREDGRPEDAVRQRREARGTCPMIEIGRASCRERV